MREFKINENIALKLENRKTNIYMNGEFFDQCKFLLLEIPINNIESSEEVQSIDQAAECLDSKLENGMDISNY